MSTVRLDKLAGLIEWPDDDARTEAVRLLRERREDPLGRLGDAAAWLAAVSGQCPPPTQRAKLLVFTDDGLVPEIVARVATGTGRSVHGARADGGTSGIWDALARGALLADAEADAGIDLILLAAPSEAARIPAATLIAFANQADAQTVASTLRGDQEWMRTVSAVRDSLRRVKKVPEDDTIALLEALGGTELAHLTGVILGAAARRLPIVFEGLPATAAAVMAHRVTGAAGSWFMPAHADPDPASGSGLRHMGRTALLDLGLFPGDGIAVVLAASMLDAATAALAGDDSNGATGETWFSDPLSPLSEPPRDPAADPPGDAQPW